jgi:hypothetical protein
VFIRENPRPRLNNARFDVKFLGQFGGAGFRVAIAEQLSLFCLLRLVDLLVTLM